MYVLKKNIDAGVLFYTRKHYEKKNTQTKQIFFIIIILQISNKVVQYFKSVNMLKFCKHFLSKKKCHRTNIVGTILKNIWMMFHCADDKLSTEHYKLMDDVHYKSYINVWLVYGLVRN